MSRMRNLAKRKQKIKESMIGLSLAISIGMAGCLGSYAYFSDQVKSENGIKVTMGTLNAALSNAGSEKVDLTKEKKSGALKFTITNDGTLDQYIKVGFDEFKIGESKANNDVLGNIPCEITLKYNGKTIYLNSKEDTSKLNKLSSIQGTLMKVVDKDGKEQRFNVGDKIEGTLTINIDGLTDEQYKAIQEKTITFNTNVDAQQINYSEGGSK